jgi:hypothetical protein
MRMHTFTLYLHYQLQLHNVAIEVNQFLEFNYGSTSYEPNQITTGESDLQFHGNEV